MIVRALDINGDWQFGKGRNDYKRNLSAVTQSIKTRLFSFLGDCFFALNEGIDWFNLMGSKDLNAVRLAISTTILNTQNVTGILQLSVNLSPTNRALTVQYKVQTTMGETGEDFIYDANGLA